MFRNLDGGKEMKSKKELRNELMNYPFIKPDPKLQRNLMQFGLDVGVGWLGIIKEAWDKINELENLPENFEIFQVKEKFGELTIYPEEYNEDINDILLKARQKSIHTCEICGSEFAQKENINGWFKTICEKCKGEKK